MTVSKIDPLSAQIPLTAGLFTPFPIILLKAVTPLLDHVITHIKATEASGKICEPNLRLLG
jgi:hypothetical protein